MQKKTVQNVLLHTLATGLFLFVFSLNLSVSLKDGWSLGFNLAKADAADDSKKYYSYSGKMSCQDFTATEQRVSNNTGQVGIYLKLGTKYGEYGAGANVGAPGTTTATMEIAIAYPRNADGSAFQYDYVDCVSGGSESCRIVSPCRDVALSRLGIQP